MTTLALRDFDAEIEAEARAAAHARACRYTEADLARAVAEAEARAHEAGRAEGHSEGREEAMGEIALRQAQATEALTPLISRMLEDRLTHHATLERQLVGFALAVCEKVFPEFIAARSAEAAAADIRRALSLALRSPRLRIRLSEATRALMAPELDALARESLDARQIDIAADPALADGEARVDWHDGFMESSFEAVCAGILETLRETAGRHGRPTRKAD